MKKKNNYYFDNNASTPILPEVQALFRKFLGHFGNPSSIHKFGRKAKVLLEEARETIAVSLGVSSDEIIFVSSGTEGNNHVFYSIFYNFLETQTPHHIIISSIEHPSVTTIAKKLANYEGFDLTILPVNSQGYISLEALKSAVKPHTKLISIMLANHEIGTIQPLEEIADFVDKCGILLHSDAIQALGKMPINLNVLKVSFMTFSGHKVYAPKGVGILFKRKGVSLNPLLYGASHEYGLRSGTENVPSILALSKAIQLMDLKFMYSHVRIWRDRLCDGLLVIPDIKILTPIKGAVLPNTLSVAFKNIDGMALVMRLDMEGFSISTGSACSSGTVAVSPVLKAMGVSPEYLTGAIRISLGFLSTEEEIGALINCIIRNVTMLRDVASTV